MVELCVCVHTKKMKREFSVYTDQETQATFPEMSNASYRSRSGFKKRRFSKSAGLRRTVPRAISSSGGNGCIVPLTVDADFSLTTDIAKGFAFDTGYMYASGTGYAIPGASELQAVFSMLRIHKIEMTIIPGATGLDYSAQSITTGVTNIPYVYHAIDYQNGDTPTLSEMRQNVTCKTDSMNKVIRRTCYPRLEGTNGIIDVSANRKNLFMEAGETSTQKWHGFKVLLDCAQQVWTYGQCRFVFKIYFECRQSK